MYRHLSFLILSLTFACICKAQDSLSLDSCRILALTNNKRLRISHEKTYAGAQPMEEEAEDDERLAFEGSKVELHQLALTLTLLELPIRFVCEPECDVMKKARQDNESHACQKELPDQHPFSALQQLLTKDQEV